ncbi:unnamed protein product, partial [Phaeothamnion confervicola]
EVKATLPLGIAPTGLRFRIDALSAFFGIVVNLVVAVTSLYGCGLDRQADMSPRIEPYFPLFVIAMNAVLIADDALAFLFSWELMSLTSWLLVVARHRDLTVRFAAYVYLLMAVIGTMALLFAFAAMS